MNKLTMNNASTLEEATSSAAANFLKASGYFSGANWDVADILNWDDEVEDMVIDAAMDAVATEEGCGETYNGEITNRCKLCINAAAHCSYLQDVISDTVEDYAEFAKEEEDSSMQDCHDDWGDRADYERAMWQDKMRVDAFSAFRS